MSVGVLSRLCDKPEALWLPFKRWVEEGRVTCLSKVMAGFFTMQYEAELISPRSGVLLENTIKHLAREIMTDYLNAHAALAEDVAVLVWEYTQEFAKDLATVRSEQSGKQSYRP